MWGYDTLVDQVVLGSCVEHEIDVVAWKGESLAMVEAKYHNEAMLKSDLKVVLYVEERFDDIAPNFFDYGGVKRKLTERWLVTNTKFTDKAITYGECKSMKLVGWNYPAKGNLHQIIEENGLHPVTCINSLTRDQKKALVAKDVLACIDLVSRPEILDQIGLASDQKEKVLTEAQIVIEQAK